MCLVPWTYTSRQLGIFLRPYSLLVDTLSDLSEVTQQVRSSVVFKRVCVCMEGGVSVVWFNG